MTKDGRFETTTMKEDNVVMYSRYLSQGSDSMLLVKVRRVYLGECSTMVLLDVCRINKIDFDSNEVWTYKLVSIDADIGVEEALNGVCNMEGRTSIYSKMYDTAHRNRSDLICIIDPTIYTTVLLEDIIYSATPAARYTAW